MQNKRMFRNTLNLFSLVNKIEGFVNIKININVYKMYHKSQYFL